MSTLAYVGIGWVTLIVLFVWGHARWYNHLDRINPHGAEQD